MEKTPVSERKTVTKDLISFSLHEVEKKYGKGQKNGLIPLDYHNLLHSQDVLRAVEQLTAMSSNNGKISQEDGDLVKIAAASHDIEQGLGSGRNEVESARIIGDMMKKSQVYTKEDIAKVKKMILATTVYFKNGAKRQSATEDYLTQIIADADLASLGQESNLYWEKAESLLREMNKTDTPAPEDKLAFMKSQLRFLENHTFYTDEAKLLFPHKQENIAFVRAKIQQDNNS